MTFNGDLYPTAGASSVLTTKGDIVRYNTERERYGIGSAGQVLQVASSLPTWSTINLADSVLTTQGDVLYEGASALARLGQSTNNYTLATKGAGANPAWQASSTSTLTTAGDLLYASGANTLARLARGSDNQVLTMNGTALNWETPAGGGGNYEFIEQFTATAATTFTCDLSSALAVGDFVDLVAIWRGKWNASGSGALELQIATDNSDPITNSGYSWASNVLTSSSTFTSGGDVDNFTVGASTTSAGSRGNIIMDLTVGNSTVENEVDIFLKWWQVGTNVQNAWGSGFTYDSAEVGSINGFKFTNGAGNNIKVGTTLDVYKITS